MPCALRGSYTMPVNSTGPASYEPMAPMMYGGVTPEIGAASAVFMKVSIPPPPISGVFAAASSILNLPAVSVVRSLMTCVTMSERSVS